MPIGTGLALAIGGAAAAGGSVAGGLIQKSAAEDATNAQVTANRESIAAQKEAADKAIGFAREQAGIARQDLAPFRESQLQALTQLQGLADPNSKFFTQQRDIATQAIQRQLSAQGLLRSNAQADQLGSLEAGLAQNRAQILGGLAGTGAVQSSAGISAGLGQQLAAIQGGYGQQVGSSLQALGQTIAQGRLAQGQALAGAVQGIGGAFQGTLGNYLAANNQQQLFDLLRGAGGGTGVTGLGGGFGGGSYDGRWGRY